MPHGISSVTVGVRDAIIAGDSAEALLEVRDLPHPRFLLDDLQNRLGFGVLSHAEKTVWLADHCGYLLGIDSLRDFHWDERGDNMPAMHDALVAVGATKAAAKLHAYMELYGPDGPPATTAERRTIAEYRGDAWGQSIEALAELHHNWEEVTTLAIQYELRHGEQFHKASEIRKILNRPGGPSALNR